MHETLFSTKAKSDQPYISTLVLFKDHTVPTLDAITRNIVIPHIDAEPLGSEGNDRLSMGNSTKKSLVDETSRMRRLVVMTIRGHWLVIVTNQG